METRGKSSHEGMDKFIGWFIMWILFLDLHLGCVGSPKLVVFWVLSCNRNFNLCPKTHYVDCMENDEIFAWVENFEKLLMNVCLLWISVSSPPPWLLYVIIWCNSLDIKCDNEK